MTEDIYIIAIALLLPLTAGMVVFQTNPYHALVIRGILGALAALVYALFGAADVALTEALVGTMLSITLYAIAVRSSMRMQLGILVPEADSEHASPHTELLKSLRFVLQPYHLYLETIAFSSLQDLKAALHRKDLHGILIPHGQPVTSPEDRTYDLHVRLQRLADIFQPALPQAITSLTVIDLDTETQPSDAATLNPGVDR